MDGQLAVFEFGKVLHPVAAADEDGAAHLGGGADQGFVRFHFLGDGAVGGDAGGPPAADGAHSDAGPGHGGVDFVGGGGEGLPVAAHVDAVFHKGKAPGFGGVEVRRIERAVGADDA